MWGMGGEIDIGVEVLWAELGPHTGVRPKSMYEILNEVESPSVA